MIFRTIITNHKWILNWIILSIAATLISFIAGYGYLFAFAFFFPLAQTIALSKIPHAKMTWLWMIHVVYWILLIKYGSSYNSVVIGILGSSFLGQLVLLILFGTFGKFQWIIFNTLGLSAFLLAVYLMREVKISNDFIEILLVIGLTITPAFLSGLGIKRGFF